MHWMHMYLYVSICMYAYVYVYICTYSILSFSRAQRMHVYVCIYVYMYVYIPSFASRERTERTCMYVYMYICIYVCISHPLLLQSARMYVCTYEGMYVCTYEGMYVCIFSWMKVCMYAYSLECTDNVCIMYRFIFSFLYFFEKKVTNKLIFHLVFLLSLNKKYTYIYYINEWYFRQWDLKNQWRKINIL
jgi:hypothetical protein